MGVRHPVTFDMHPTHRGSIEQNIDQVVRQQVDLVDVENATVRAGEQAR